MTTLEPRPYHTRTVENCDQLINKHLAKQPAEMADKLQHLGLSAQQVREMTAHMQEHQIVLFELKNNEWVDCGRLQVMLDKTPQQIGRLIADLRADGHEIETLYYGKPLITSYRLKD